MMTDNATYIMGLGVSDPKRVFGTTVDLEEIFGRVRVFETPTSENAMTGVAVGLCLAGNRVISIHQRLDFFLLAMDQLVNSAAKWNYMFGDQTPINLTIRLIVGRGWGQGPTHSQNLQSWFSHIPGLKVVALSRGIDVYGILRAAIDEPSPVIVIEDRWVHQQNVLISDYKSPVELGKAVVIRQGIDITLVTYGYFVIESIAACKILSKLGIDVELIDLRTIKPIDLEAIILSVSKTNKLAVAEATNGISSIGTDIISKVVGRSIDLLTSSPLHIAYPDSPEPTSHGVIGNFIPGALQIAQSIANKFEKSLTISQIQELTPSHFDTPNPDFKGPF
jgi:pyruvate/2-oxoglutarate/acetoin dehydrogenase E1 component